MLQSTLSNVRQIVKNLEKISDSQLDSLMQLISLYDYDTFIHPGSIMNKICIDSSKAYIILTELVKNKILEMDFQYYCYGCRSFNGKTYFDVNYAPSNIYCEHCGRELCKEKNIVVVYRVVS